MSTRAEDPEKQLDGFIGKFCPEHQSLIRAARKRLRWRFPSAHELVYDNSSFFVIGVGRWSGRPMAIFSIAAAANGAGLCFMHGAKLPDPKKVLQGAGKQTRFLRLPSAELLEDTDVTASRGAAVARCKTPLTPAAEGSSAFARWRRNSGRDGRPTDVYHVREKRSA